MTNEEYQIFKKVEKEFHLEDIEAMLMEKYGYTEATITEELLEQVYHYYYKGLENDSSWRDILEVAIDSTLELFKERSSKNEQ